METGYAVSCLMCHDHQEDDNKQESRPHLLPGDIVPGGNAAGTRRHHAVAHLPPAQRRKLRRTARQASL